METVTVQEDGGPPDQVVRSSCTRSGCKVPLNPRTIWRYTNYFTNLLTYLGLMCFNRLVHYEDIAEDGVMTIRRISIHLPIVISRNVISPNGAAIGTKGIVAIPYGKLTFGDTSRQIDIR